MDIFEQAKAHADDVAPAPADRPLAAALTALGFGIFVIGAFLFIRWFGVEEWLAWIIAASLYALIAYGDCLIGWSRHTREYRNKLAELKADRTITSLH